MIIDPAVFGQNIRLLREAKRLTEYELAIQVDIDSPQLSKIELGKQLPTVRTAVNIANYFGLSLCDLFKNSYENTAPNILKITSLLADINDDVEYAHLINVLRILRDSVED